MQGDHDRLEVLADGSWMSEHPETFLRSLEDAFELGRLVNARSFPSLAGELG